MAEKIENAETTETIDACETTTRTPAEILRNGWLAYLGLYGAAYERMKPLTEKTVGVIEELIAKGENVEANAQDVAEDVRTRATDLYGDRFTSVRKYFPDFTVKTGRVEELEAEIAALNKKVDALTKNTEAKAA